MNVFVIGVVAIVAIIIIVLLVQLSPFTAVLNQDDMIGNTFASTPYNTLYLVEESQITMHDESSRNVTLFYPTFDLVEEDVLVIINKSPEMPLRPIDNSTISKTTIIEEDRFMYIKVVDESYELLPVKKNLSVLVIAINIEGNTTSLSIKDSNFFNYTHFTPASIPQINDTFFGDKSLQGYMQYISHGQLNIVGDVIGPYLINLSTLSDNCYFTNYMFYAFSDNRKCDVKFRNAVLQLSPKNVSAYDYIFFVWPKLNSSEVGFSGQVMTPQIIYINGFYSKKEISLYVLAHELVHTFHNGSAEYDFSHVHGFGCPFLNTTLRIVSVPNLDNKSCVSVDYGDPYDLMGPSTLLWSPNFNGVTGLHGYAAKQFNNYFNLSFMPDSAVQKLPSFPNSSEVVLSPVMSSSGTKMLILPINVNRESDGKYVVDFRSWTSWEPYNFSSPILNGVSLHFIKNYDSTLLDMHPETASFEDAMLLINESILLSIPIPGRYSGFEWHYYDYWYIKVLGKTPEGNMRLNVTYYTYLPSGLGK